MGVRNTGKVRNQQVAKLRIVFIPILFLVKKLFHDSSFMVADDTSINNTNELHLLMNSAFLGKKKESTGGQNQFERKQYTGSN